MRLQEGVGAPGYGPRPSSSAVNTDHRIHKTLKKLCNKRVSYQSKKKILKNWLPLSTLGIKTRNSPPKL